MNVYVSDAPALRLAETLVEVLAGLPEAHVAVSGGSSPRPLFQALAGPLRDKVDWPRMRLYQVDERCVPPTHKDSNWRMLSEELLRHVPIKAYRIEAERVGAAEAYEALLRAQAPGRILGPPSRFVPRLAGKGVARVPRAGGCSSLFLPALDIVLLGMGADGHTASLFSGTPALDESVRLMAETTPPAAPHRRVTMTFPLLRAARRRFFLVTGADKADAFSRAVMGELPAGQIGDADWFIDHPCAGGV